MKKHINHKIYGNCAYCNDDLINSFKPKELFGYVYCDICQQYRRPWLYKS